MAIDILPDSRTRYSRESVRGPNGITYIPLHCANCGKKGGMVPEKMITFAFYLCQSPCAEKYGDDAHFYKEPDEVFWERVAAAELEDRGRPLTPQELVVELEDTSSVFRKLADEWLAHVRRTER
jgi:hypothetical protein